MRKIKLFFFTIIFASTQVNAQAVGTPYLFNYQSIFVFNIQGVTGSGGKIWLDRNLGADKVAPKKSDSVNMYSTYMGGYYQWGRLGDGHEKYLSTTYTGTASTATASASNSWNGKFIINSTASPYDWLTTQDVNLWQGINGSNNPCPTGYRVPTQAEWDAEGTRWTGSKDIDAAFASPLKIAASGQRTTAGTYSQVGSDGLYWTSTISGVQSTIMRIVPGGTYNFENKPRASGYAVRCIQN